MVLDFYLGRRHQRQRYKVAQEGYSYPQAGYPPMGTGYNITPLPHHQPQNLPMGYGHSYPYGYGHDHAHGHDYQHQNQQNGMNTYSATTMGFGGNPGSSVGHGYRPSFTGETEKHSNIYLSYKKIDD